MSEVEKITEYMNKHQKVALYDFLQYYKGINFPLDDRHYDVSLASFNKEGFVLSYKDSGKQQQAPIPFSPPLKHVQEARGRFVEMAFKAADAFHKSPTRIKRYICPASANEIALFLSISTMMFVLISITFGLTWPRDFNFFGPKGTLWIKRLTQATLGIHVIEFFFTVSPLLRKYRAPVRTWIVYAILTTTVGFPSWIPLKRKVAELESYRAKFVAKQENADK